MKRSLAIVAGALGALWLISTGVLLFYVAGLTGVPALLLAFVTMDSAFLALLALFLVTNTRIDQGASMRSAVDPFSMTSEDLKNAVLLADNMPYGRRKHDDTAVVKRLIGKFEDEDALRPAPAQTPKWALDLQSQPHADASAIFPDVPQEVS